MVQALVSKVGEIVITEQESRYSPEPGMADIRLDNQIVLRSVDGARSIIAVGSSRQWNSTRPLPGDAQRVDLLEVLATDPRRAADLWGSFLACLVYMARPSLWKRLAFTFAPRLAAIPVRLDIPNAASRAALAKAIAEGRCGGWLKPCRAD
jgi:hypothetical protein